MPRQCQMRKHVGKIQRRITLWTLPILIKLGCLTLKVAQLAAHMTCNHDVAGSIPAFRKKVGFKDGVEGTSNLTVLRFI